jgi:hypothetical protein
VKVEWRHQESRAGLAEDLKMSILASSEVQLVRHKVTNTRSHMIFCRLHYHTSYCSPCASHHMSNCTVTTHAPCMRLHGVYTATALFLSPVSLRLHAVAARMQPHLIYRYSKAWSGTFGVCICSLCCQPLNTTCTFQILDPVRMYQATKTRHKRSPT